MPGRRIASGFRCPLRGAGPSSLSALGLRLMIAAFLLLLPPLAARAASDASAPRLLIDDFEDVSAWSAHPASGVELAIRSDAGAHGRAMRLDFHFTGGGYAVARRPVAIDLPPNYRLRFAVRGKCLPNDLELKLIDASGENVWWMNRRGFVFPERWDTLVTRKRQITFAWGPIGGGEIRHVAAIEIAVTAGQGGTGSVWLDDFTLEPMLESSATPPALRARASSGIAGAAVDGDTATAWQPPPGDLEPWLEADLGIEREFGGLTLKWRGGRHASDYAIELSPDGRAWRTAREVHRGNGGNDPLALPESEARFVRVRPLGTRARGIALAEIVFHPLAWSATPESFYAAIAHEAPRGFYPRAIAGEATSWTLVGRRHDREEGLLSEDGALETGKARFSIEPFVWTEGRLITWADASITRRLEDPGLPIPSVTWRAGDLELEVMALGAGERDRPEIWARYRLANRGTRAIRARLYLALRPFQVNPPGQLLNTPGGTARVTSITRQNRTVRVNGDRGLTMLTPPDQFGAATFDEGDVVADWLRYGRVPRLPDVVDATERASAALAYDARLAPGAERSIVIVVPLERPPRFDLNVRSMNPAEQFAWRLERAARDGRDAVEKVTLHLPSRDLERTLNAQLGWILLNQDGPSIQPGSRSYERSWIRDGSLTSSALLRLGHPEVVREFAEWFANYQYPDGKVPCCVDQRGADPVPENDSHGELIYLIAEYYRYTGDRATAERLWPHVLGAARYLDSLRSTRRGPEWSAPAKREFFGLLPPSISHEGYSAKPMHSYWDDLFALRGYKDAAFLAEALGHDADGARLVASRDEFAHDLAASIRAAMARHKIDYVPGCADLGDFDATSTTIALAPAGAESLMPKGALERTFERYWEFFRDRRDGKKAWEAFTPYEIRTIGAFVRLGWRDRANEALRYFMAHRNPPEWHQWAEVVWSDTLKPHFIGDLPHTWVGSDFVRSVLDMLAYERESDSTLVIGAGIGRDWVFGGEGVQVGALPTRYGKLGFTMREEGQGLLVRVEPGIRVPRGGIVVSPPPPPGKAAWRSATIDGVAVKLGARGEVVLRKTGVNVAFRP
jgi:hypothetical protein